MEPSEGTWLVDQNGQATFQPAHRDRHQIVDPFNSLDRDGFLRAWSYPEYCVPRVYQSKPQPLATTQPKAKNEGPPAKPPTKTTVVSSAPEPHHETHADGGKLPWWILPVGLVLLVIREHPEILLLAVGCLVWWADVERHHKNVKDREGKS